MPVSYLWRHHSNHGHTVLYIITYLFSNSQNEVSIQLKVEEIDNKRSEKGLIDILTLNFTAAIRSQLPKRLHVTGVDGLTHVTGLHGLVNMTWRYRLKFGIVNSTSEDGCVIISLPHGYMKSEYTQYHEVEAEELTPFPAVKIGDNSSVSTPSNALPHSPAPPRRQCLSRKEAIKLVVYSIFMTSMILCTFVSLTYNLVNFCCTPRTVAERESILEKFLEEGTQALFVYI